MGSRDIPDEYYPDDGFEDLRQVNPVHWFHKNTGQYEQEYSFSAIHVDAIDLPMTSGGRMYFEDSIGVWSVYKNKPPVLLKDDRVLAHVDADRGEAERQAYFALSILAKDGLVSNFTKR